MNGIRTTHQGRVQYRWHFVDDFDSDEDGEENKVNRFLVVADETEHVFHIKSDVELENKRTYFFSIIWKFARLNL